MKIARTGGPVQTIVETGNMGAWNAEGALVFRTAAAGFPLLRPGSTNPVAITNPEPGQSQDYPVFLPGGRHFLFHSAGLKPEQAGIFVGSIDGNTPVRLLPDSSDAQYLSTNASSGFLLFRRAGALFR